MEIFLKNILHDISKLSKRLDKQALFMDKPWALLDSDLKIQKLIFKKNKELIMSKDGSVTVGKWEYLPEAKSILIDRGYDKILCNEQFLDDGAMILKLDGSSDKFFILANENKIPDLNVFKYLEQLRYREFKIVTRIVTGNQKLEIHNGHRQDDLNFGLKVTLDGKNIDDGEFFINEINPKTLLDEKKKFVIKFGKLLSIVYIKDYLTVQNITLTFEQMEQYFFSRGDKVLINESPAQDGVYKLKGGKKIVIKNGMFFKRKFF
jgi:hypothetical protein